MTTICIESHHLFELAGTLSVPFMRDNPDYVMPSEEVVEIVRRFIAEHRLPPAPCPSPSPPLITHTNTAGPPTLTRVPEVRVTVEAVTDVETQQITRRIEIEAPTAESAAEVMPHAAAIVAGAP